MSINEIALILRPVTSSVGVDAESDIRNAVNAGRIATAHESRINFNGWIGEGYILMDPKTGAGAYMISGGGNGGEVVSSMIGAGFDLAGLLFGYEQHSNSGNVSAVYRLLGAIFNTVGAVLASIFTLFDISERCKQVGFTGTAFLMALHVAIILAFTFFAFFTGGLVTCLTSTLNNEVLKSVSLAATSIVERNVMNNSMDSVFYTIFIAISFIALFTFYIIYYRGVVLRRRLTLYAAQVFPQLQSMTSESQSKYMECEGGYTLVRVRIDDLNDLLIYQFLVGGQLNMRRFLVHVQRGVHVNDAIYGRGHISRECKSRQLYVDFKAIDDLGSKVRYLRGAVSVIEVCDETAYCYYQLNSFFGSYPIKQVLGLIERDVNLGLYKSG